ncbi:MAG: phosphate acyltransferase PlsX, partial [Clostridium sp.]|nr:phosphate acyltransferase PlsX [Clostridium sp.]
MKFAVDGMGGDYSPGEIVKGSVLASKEYGVEIVITGPLDLINKELEKYTYDKDKITVVNATEVISLEESPVLAIRRKKDSSLRKAFDLEKEGKVDGVISAGSTGALLAGGLLLTGRIKGVDRAALGSLMPGKNNEFMLLDLGANADIKAHNLVEFAKMGTVYFETIMGKKNPTVGLINIGAEAEKGNELTKEGYILLNDEKNINFVGNVEPREISNGDVDILVADGFTGNVILKMYEGVSKNLMYMIKEEMLKTFRGKLGGLLLKPSLKSLLKRNDYKETGGAVLLGINGIVVKAHGTSDSHAFKNAI